MSASSAKLETSSRKRTGLANSGSRLAFGPGAWRHPHSEDEFRNAIRLGLVAWNTALLPKERQVETIERFIDEVVHDGADDFRQVVYEMIDRKQRWFAQIKRLILKYHLTVTENGPHLSGLNIAFFVGGSCR